MGRLKDIVFSVTLTFILSIVALQGMSDPMISSMELKEKPFYQLPTRSGISIINIENETDLNEKASLFGWPGNGSSGNPYIISGMIENLTGYDQGIYIANTTSHVHIRNCSLTSALRNSIILDPAGIRGHNVSNISISKCLLNNNHKGIDIKGDNISITDCNISNSGNVGVNIGGYDIDIQNNTMINNQVSIHVTLGFSVSMDDNRINYGSDGIGIYRSEECSITDNRIGNQTYYGIETSSSSRISIALNDISNNRIGVYSNNDNTVEIGGNAIHDNVESGVNSRSSDNFRIHDNTLYDNDDAIYLFWSSDNWDIVDNRINNCRNGVNIQMYSRYIRVGGNNITNCDGSGILVMRTNSVTIEENILDGNFIHGVDSEDSHSLDVFNNKITGNNNGLDISDGSDFKVINNTISHNSDGVFLSNMYDVSFFNNTVSYNENHGLILTTSNRNDVRNNSFRKNGQYGIYLLTGRYNLIQNNTFVYNMGTGDYPDNKNLQCYDGNLNNSWYLEERGNYWRDHWGNDSNSDGIVDIPYNLSGSTNSDLYPLVEPPFSTIPGIPRDFEVFPRDGRVKLEWSTPLTDGGSVITGYRLFRTENLTSNWIVVDTVDDDSYTYNDTGLVNAKRYFYRIRSLNMIGLGGSTPIRSALPDGESPELVIEYPEQNSFIGFDTIEARFSAEDRINPISGYLVEFDGSGWVDNGQSENITIHDIEEGPHTLKVRAFDLAENYVDSSVQFTVDTMDPEITDISPANGSYLRSRDFTLHFNGSDKTTRIEYFETKLDDWNWVFHGMNNSRDFFDLAAGNHTIIIRAYDRAGNFDEHVLRYFIDLEPPRIDIIEPIEGHLTSKDNISVRWSGIDSESGIDHYVYRLDSNEWLETNYTSIELVDLSTGIHKLEVHAYDLAGNIGKSVVNFTVDKEAPVIVEFGPSGDEVKPDEEIYVLFSKSMNRTTTIVTVNGREAYFVWNNRRAIIAFGGNMDYNTEYTIVINGMDLVGNRLEEFIWKFSTTNLGRLRGKIHDRNRKPMENVRVIVDGQEIMRTGADGIFDFDLISGTHSLKVQLDGYVTESINLTIEPGSEFDIGIITLEEVEYTGKVVGRVLDTGGDPIQGLIVSISTGDSDTTDNEGRFSLESEVGYYNLTIEGVGYIPFYTWVDVPKDGTNDIGDITMEKDTDSTPDSEESSGLSPTALILIFLVIVGIGALLLILLVVKKKETETLLEE